MKKEINLVSKILEWYCQFGRKELPWQLERTLYKTWISEIMLQQTQVKIVIPYFQRFMEKFPTIIHLSIASLDEILHLWTGLGYYARARNIYKTALLITKKYQGKFPTNFDDVISLPGIGRSTAGAILSLTLNQHYPILDGNIKRILNRYYAISNDCNSSKVEKQLWNISEKITPSAYVSKFNQAMMDLGSIICKRYNPKCDICPIVSDCQAYSSNNVIHYPRKKSKKNIPKKIAWFLIIQHNNKVWLEKRPISGLWGGLFCFPQFSEYKEVEIWTKKQELNIILCKSMVSFYHIFSHFHLKIIPIWITVRSINSLMNENSGIWYDLNKPPSIGISIPIVRLLCKLEKFNKNMEFSTTIR